MKAFITNKNEAAEYEAPAPNTRFAKFLIDPDVLGERNLGIAVFRYEKGQVVRFPIAHKDGSYFADEETLKRLEGEGRVAFRYCTPQGEVTAEANPNGSRNNIAGVYSESRTVLGLMPHPERLADPALSGTDGVKMFKGLVESLAA